MAVENHGLVSFTIDESSPNWPRVRSWIGHRRPVDVVSTKFTRAEIEKAEWLELVPAWHHGYPQPDEDSMGFLSATYDLSEWCDECGVGLKQARPFQMRGEPRWGRNAILQLHWVLDEFFVKRDAWEESFRPLGIRCREVENTHGTALRTVVQLSIEEEVAIRDQDLIRSICSKCTRTRYLPVQRGPFPEPAGPIVGAMARTAAYFGSGRQSCRRILVSGRTREVLQSQNLKGVSYRPAGPG